MRQKEMTIATPTYDVFLSHSLRDQEFATDVANRLKAEGLQPFSDASIGPGEEVSKAIWDALAECHAFIVIVSPESPPDAMGMVELGAATAWNKPIFVVLNGPASSPLPETLQSYRAYPSNRIDEVLSLIRHNLEPFTVEDRQVLINSYLEVGISADRLVQSPRDLQDLVNSFNSSADKELSGSQVLSELLRMRKSAKLPRIGPSRRVTKR